MTQAAEGVEARRASTMRGTLGGVEAHRGEGGERGRLLPPGDLGQEGEAEALPHQPAERRERRGPAYAGGIRAALTAMTGARQAAE